LDLPKWRACPRYEYYTGEPGSPHIRDAFPE
jgi:hypothetical protein